SPTLLNLFEAIDSSTTTKKSYLFINSHFIFFSHINYLNSGINKITLNKKLKNLNLLC
ncbi:hypothetical protein CP8484711_1398, partial [Chlamydia psittaci 84-8471/1]